MTIQWTAFPAAVAAVSGDIVVGLQGGTVNYRFLATSWLFTANNLSDVADATTSFDNISPLTTTGDIIYFDGAHNVRLAIGSTGQQLTVVGALPEWATNPSPTFLQIQDQSATFAVAAGTANALTLTLSPALGAYADGQYISFRAGATNTGAATMAVNGLATEAIVTNGNAALIGGEIVINGDYMAIYNSNYGAYVLINSSLDVDAFLTIANNLSDVADATTSFDNISPLTTTGDLIYFDGTHNVRLGIGSTDQQLTVVGGLPAWATNPSPTFAQVQSQSSTYAVDTGAANAYVIALSPVVSVYADGQAFMFKATNANTGATTLDAGGGAVAIVTNANAALTGGEILANGQYNVSYNSTFTAFVLQ